MQEHGQNRAVRGRIGISRRSLLCAAATVPLGLQLRGVAYAAPLPVAPHDRVHNEVWRRFVDPYNVVLDYTALDGSYDRPTAEECRLAKPNALAWWTPVENGAMFNGLYMDALVNRALQTGNEEDRRKARRLAEGLLLLAGVGGVDGFIARCVAEDGITTYPMGSNDQTAPWFYGLWRYVNSGLAEGDLRRLIVEKMMHVAGVLRGTGWRMPAAAPFDFRGSFARISWDGAPRLLFLMKLMHALSGDESWERDYHAAAAEADASGLTRVEACRIGFEGREKAAAWTGSVSAACLRELWNLEQDPALKAAFGAGLSASATFAATFLPAHREFDNAGQAHFEGDWRKLNALWKPQHTVEDALSVAREQLTWKNQHSPRRREELKLVREPCFAAWIISLCPDQAAVDPHRETIQRVLVHYQYERLRYSQFFPIEAAWWRLSAG